MKKIRLVLTSYHYMGGWWRDLSDIPNISYSYNDNLYDNRSCTERFKERHSSLNSKYTKKLRRNSPIQGRNY